MIRKNRTAIGNVCFIVLLMVLFFGCEGPSALFKGKYAHQRYAEQLKSAGLEKSLLYRRWLTVAKQSLKEAQYISIPYQEEAYFVADRPQAAAFTFKARRGERLVVALSLQAADTVQLFADLFQAPVDTNQMPKHLLSADTNARTLSYVVTADDSFLLRIQPELLAAVSYHLQITAEPSLASPISAEAKSHIGSFFGDGRDAGGRRHEGVDIFAQRLTPAVAAVDGLVTRVGTNRLGGNVVWLRPYEQSVTLYYAHLDTQLVSAGRRVSLGDTLGLVGNTGNARTTPPHLHFGIYTSSGAVDPLPFLRPQKSDPPKILADRDAIGDTLRVQNNKNSFSPSGSRPFALGRYTPVYIEGVTQRSYRVLLPDGRKGLVAQEEVTRLAKALKSTTLKREQVVYDQPNVNSAHLRELTAGERVSVLAEYQGFSLVDGQPRGWIVKE